MSVDVGAGDARRVNQYRTCAFLSLFLALVVGFAFGWTANVIYRAVHAAGDGMVLFIVGMTRVFPAIALAGAVSFGVAWALERTPRSRGFLRLFYAIVGTIPWVVYLVFLAAWWRRS